MIHRKLLAVLVLSALATGACGNRQPSEQGAQTAATPAPAAGAPAAAPSESGGTTNDTATTGTVDTGTAGAASPAASPSSPAARSASGTAAQPGAATGSAANSPSSGSAAASPASPNGGQPAPKQSAGKAPSGAQPAAPGPGTPTPTPPGSPAPAPSGAKAPVTIGWVGLMSGVIGTIGAGIPPAVRAWVSDANTRGGLAGHPVKLVMADDGGDPNKSVALARRMIEENKVIAFLGAFAPTTEQALTPLLEEKQVPIVSTCGCSPADDQSPMVFPVGPSGDLGTGWAHILPMLNGNVPTASLQKVGLMYCREVPSCAHMRELMKTQFESKAGFKIVWEAQVNQAAPNYTAEVLAARNAGVQVMTVILGNDPAIRAVRSAREQGWNVPFSVQQAGYEDRLIKNGGATVEGMLTASTTLPWESSPGMAPFREAMDKYQPGAVKGSWGAQDYVAGRLLEKIAAGFSDNPTAADVLKGLWSLKGETMGGLLPPITYTKGAKTNGDVNLCIVPITVKGGKFTPTQGDRFTCAPR